MPERKWTEEQRQAIEAEGGTILVSAAAGSGKTAVLVERVIRLITRRGNPIPADRLLVVTFTKAAAAEMKQRISFALAERIAAEPGNQLYLEQQLLLSRAHICTIHAFCGEHLRENFERLSLSPDFRIADDAEIELLKQAAVDRVLEEEYEAGEDGFLHLTEFFASRTDQLLADQVLEVYEFIRSHPFPLRWLDEQEARYAETLESGVFPWRGTVEQDALEALAYCGILVRSALEEMEGDPAMSESYRQTFEGDGFYLSELSSLLRSGKWDEAVCSAQAHRFPPLKQLRKYEDQEKKERVGQLRKEIKDELSSVKELLIRCSSEEMILEDLKKIVPVMKSLFQVVKRVYDVLEEEKRKKNVLDFSDLELLTLQSLAVPNAEGFVKTELAKECGSRFEEFLVDEDQDINEVQDTIFRTLSREESNLFLVGDVKQSIYRFRKAMPELFLRRGEASYPYDGEHFPARIRLNANFRSRAGVTDAVNYLFTALMSRGLGDVDYTEEKLIPRAELMGEESGAAQLHIIDHASADGAEEERILYEARHIAYEIRRMIAQGMQVNDRGKLRRCRFGDFCILLRSMKGKAALFEEEFKRQGVPLWNDVSSGYLDSEEVSTVLNLLRILDNPLQDIPLLSVLFSPLFGFTPDEAAQLRLLAKSEPLYLALKRFAESGGQKAEEFLRAADRFRAAAAISRLDELLQLIYDATGFMAFAGAAQNGEQRTANLRLLLEYARQYEEAGYRGVSGFIRFVDRTVERGQDLAAANVINEQADVVRLMSIHRSKGLEFPVCFVADLSKQFNTLDLRGELLLHPEKGIGLKIREPQTLKKYATLPYEALRSSIEKELLAEELRVLYVALTRPKEKLIMVLSCGDFEKEAAKIGQKAGSASSLSPYLLRGMKSFGDWIMAAMLRSKELCGALETERFRDILTAESGIGVSVYPPVYGKEALDLEVEDHAQVDGALKRQLEEHLGFCYPYEEIARLPGKMAVTQVAENPPIDGVELARPSFLLKRRFSAAERGTILHRFMQHIDLNTSDVKREIERQIEAVFLSEEQAAALDSKRISTFLRSGIAKRMRAAGESLFREYKFMYEMDASELYDVPGAERETVLIQGVADGVIAEEDGLVIIDYKTDRVDRAEELDARYRAQLELYGRALSKGFGCPIKQKVIYSFSLSEEIVLG